MFTGLIETVGTVEELRSRGNYRVITISSALVTDELSIGESIACDGSCLTVVDKNRDRNLFTVEASQETAARTVLPGYRTGSRVNLERALQVGDRLGGHFVTGHVDGIGTVDYLRSVGESLVLAVKYEKTFDVYVVEKGSVAIMGVSLTVNECHSGRLEVNLIPHTIGQTNLRELKSGGRVNLEFDLIGKYIARVKQAGTTNGLNLDTLIKSGW